MLESLIAELRKHDRAEISYKSGVSLGTINAILAGSNKDPKISTIGKLQDFIDQKNQEVAK